MGKFDLLIFLFISIDQFGHYAMQNQPKYVPESGDCVERCIGCKDGDAAKEIKFWECPLPQNEGEFRIERIFFKANTHFDDDHQCPVDDANKRVQNQTMAFQFCPNDEIGPKPKSAEGSENDTPPSCDEGFVVCFLSYLEPLDRQLIAAQFSVPNLQGNRVAQICNQNSENEAVDEENGQLLKKRKEEMPGIKHGFEVRKVGSKEFELRTSTSDKIFKFDVEKDGDCLRILLFDNNPLFNAQFYAVEKAESKILAESLEAKILSENENGEKENGEKEYKVDIVKLANGMPLYVEGKNDHLLLGLDMMLRSKQPFYLKTFIPEKGSQCIPKGSLLSNIILPVRKCTEKEGKIVECVDEVGKNGWEPMESGKIDGVTEDEDGETVINQQEKLVNLSLATPFADNIKFEVEFREFSQECWEKITDEICIKSPYANLLFYYNDVPRVECAIRIGRTKTHACISVGISTDTFEVDLTQNVTKVEDGPNDADTERELNVEIRGRKIWLNREWMEGNQEMNYTGIRLPEVCAVKNQPIQQFGMVFDVVDPYILQAGVQFGWHAPFCSNVLAVRFDNELEPLMRREGEKEKL